MAEKLTLTPAPTCAPPPPLPGINEGGIRALIQTAADKLEALEWADESDEVAIEDANDAVDAVISAARELGQNEVIMPEGVRDTDEDAGTGETIFRLADGSEKRSRASIIHARCPLCRQKSEEAK